MAWAKYAPNTKDLDVFIKRNQESGFGFRIIGGDSQPVYIGYIVPLGATWKDGRLKSGDELLCIDGVPVKGKSHEQVVDLMTNAARNGQVMLTVRRKPEGTPPVTTQDFGGELQELKTKLEKLTDRVDEGERRDMEVEKTIQTLQGSQQVVLQEIKQLTRELEKSKKKWSVLRIPSNKVKHITDQLKDKESELEKINHQLEGEQKLKSVRVKFINRVSEVNLDSLLDQLLDKGVINDHEMESVKDVRPRAEKARAIIDIVRMKGDVQSSKMLEILEKDQNFTYGSD